jgi:hypothetical protein
MYATVVGLQAWPFGHTCMICNAIVIFALHVCRRWGRQADSLMHAQDCVSVPLMRMGPMVQASFFSDSMAKEHAIPAYVADSSDKRQHDA